MKIIKSLILSLILTLLTVKSFGQIFPIGQTETSTVTWNVRNFTPATTTFGRKLMVMYDSTKFSFLISKISYDSLWLKRVGTGRSFLTVDSVTKECKLIGESNLGLKSSTITNALGFTPLSIELDADPSNEIQTLSISSNTLSISSSNSVVLPTSTQTLSISTNTLSISGGNSIVLPGSIKKIETFSGTTSGSGTYTVTYGTAYSQIPSVQVTIRNQSNVNQFALLTNSTTTGFTITVYQRNTVNLLGSEVLLATVATANGLTVDVTVVER